MDHTLRCNNLPCRAPLIDSAVVTTCSHIFCIACSSHPALSAQTPGTGRTCPACKSHLDNDDDAVQTTLNPSEDYKTSVLSGLSPAVVVECAGRGLAFWAYQCTQEIYYQEHVTKSMTNKFQSLKNKHDALELEKENVVQHLTQQLEDTNRDLQDIKTKNAELHQACRQLKHDKEQLKKVYQGMKIQQFAGDLEYAAEEDAGHALQGNLRGGFDDFENRGGGFSLHGRASSTGSGGRRAAHERYTLSNANARSGLQSARSDTRVPPTPSHRQSLAQQPTYNGRSSQITSRSGYTGVNIESLHQGTPNRQPLTSMDSNLYGNNPAGGYGVPGMKIGRQPSAQIGRSGMNNARPRANISLNTR